MQLRKLLTCLMVTLVGFTVILAPIVHAQSNVIFQNTFTLQGRTSAQCSFYVYIYLHDSKGYSVIGNITVSRGHIDLYVLTDSEFKQYTNPGSRNICTQPQNTELLVRYLTGNYSINFKVPDNSNHYFVFWNGYNGNATGTVSILGVH